MARPPRNKMEALGVAATADALENLIRDGRPEFKGDTARSRSGRRTARRVRRNPKAASALSSVRIRAEGRPAHRDQGTGRRHLPAGRTQVLLGVTGSGKTYTMAKVIEATQRPAIISRRTRRWRRSSMASSRISSPTTPWSILSLITTTTSPRPMCRGPTPISRRLLHQRADRPHAAFGDAGAVGAR